MKAIVIIGLGILCLAFAIIMLALAGYWLSEGRAPKKNEIVEV